MPYEQDTAEVVDGLVAVGAALVGGGVGVGAHGAAGWWAGVLHS